MPYGGLSMVSSTVVLSLWIVPTLAVLLGPTTIRERWHGKCSSDSLRIVIVLPSDFMDLFGSLRDLESQPECIS